MGPTNICNMALARFGAKRINDYSDASDTSPEALYCRMFYEETAKALMKDHYWPFAKKRVQLSATTTPAFQWSYAYSLPNDFLRVRSFYNGSELPDGRTTYSYEIEGATLLSDESNCYLKYIAFKSSEADWDPLFVECMVLCLAKKLCMPLSQDASIEARIDAELFGRPGRPGLMSRVRAMDRQEEQVIGRSDLLPWQNARYSDTA